MGDRANRAAAALDRESWEILQGDSLEVLRTMPDDSIDCVVTSPPYWGLRDYGDERQLGLEPTVDEYVARMVAVFAEVQRVLRDNGTLWLNLGDSYVYAGGNGTRDAARWPKQSRNDHRVPRKGTRTGLAAKNLAGVPWRVALALQADGWILRSDIVWSKPNPMPESVQDRPTKAHEYVFLFSKSPHYHYDADLVREPASPSISARYAYDFGGPKSRALADADAGGIGARARPQGRRTSPADQKRNRRTVWNVPVQPYRGAHFAVMPEALAEPCVLAGCPSGGTVLDPFAGSGTVGVVACRAARRFLGIELNPEYAGLARERLASATRQRTLF